MRNTFAYTDSHGYGNGYVHTNSYSYGNGHVHTDSHGNRDGNGYCNLHAYAYRGQTYADAQAAADASSAGAALIGTLKRRELARKTSRVPKRWACSLGARTFTAFVGSPNTNSNRLRLACIMHHNTWYRSNCPKYNCANRLIRHQDGGTNLDGYRFGAL